MALKTILVALTTVRKVDGVDKRVRFAAKSVVELTPAEMENLDKLQLSTGKLHYRDPVNEGGTTLAESKPVVEGGAVPAYDGEQIAIADKSAAQLKAFLDHYKVEYKGNASKTDLAKLAEGVDTSKTTGSTRDGEGQGGEGSGDGDPDAGL